MMYKNYLLITSLLFFTITCSQKTEDKTTESKATEKKADTIVDDDENAGYEINAKVTSTQNWDLLIPDGFELLDKTEGDLNNDGTKDILLAVKSQGEKEEELLGEDAPERRLLILLKDDKGFYSLAAESNTAIFKKNMGGAGSDDPYQEMTSKPGQFSITHMGGSTDRWTYRHTFTYNKDANAWFLTSIEEGDFDSDNPVGTAKSIKTAKQFGKINFIEYEGI